MAENRISANEGKGKNDQGPGMCERETIYWQLGFLASVVGDIPHSYSQLSENDYCGLMNLLYEIANKVFPEGKHYKE